MTGGPDRPVAERLADSFAAILALDLTPQQMSEMRRLNATPAFANGSCASHNFCDANVVMESAFYDVLMREPFPDGIDTPSGSADADLWNEAWEIARKKHLGGRA